MPRQLSKIYEPEKIEKEANEIWFSGNYFHAETQNSDAKPYTIVIPPPNVTAPLHLGHALNNTLQDILIRFHRMQQYKTLWMPGTDHAGIATQTVVEKRILSQEGKRRTDFEREDFVKRVQDWKDQYEARIIEQLKAMGCSCDWQRTRFTMDDVCAKAVRTAFFRLFEDGLIYRGKRLVNWDPATQTVLADDEVEHETVEGHFWYMQYPLEEPQKAGSRTIEYVTVATTRPETMLGDTAVAINPADPRAQELVGKNVRLPLVGRLIPIVADEHVVIPDPDSEDEKARYSTGFLKVTPAHDLNDWEIGLRHDLPVINVLAPDGTISDKHGWNDAGDTEAESLLGMDRFEAREAVVDWFRHEGLLEKVLEYTHEVGHSYRSHVPIEPYMSDQWYIAVKEPIDRLADKFGRGTIEGTDIPVNSLAGLALKPLLDGRLKFIPERYAKTYQDWLENLRDWPISRQLWWGHRIGIWAKDFEIDNKKKLEGIEQNPTDMGWMPLEIKPEWQQHVRAHCRIDKDNGLVTAYICPDQGAAEIEEYLSRQGFTRDPDVLDTWFSSALWPFSTLGWPDDSDELRKHYPGNVLCTAREIITLWVSRMVMMGQYCAGEIPFYDVYIHAMIQDGQGRKMSKSLGNGIDPLVAINSHGCDAMRFTLASMTTETQDVRMPVETMELPDGRKANTSPKFDIGRNFCNKLWNASRFAIMNLENLDPDAFRVDLMDITDRWILSRLTETVKTTTESLNQYKYSEPLSEIYRFFWNDFCSWYLEWAKPRMNDPQQRPIAQNVLAFVLDQILRLLHPFVPFITEGIFQKLNEVAPSRYLKGLAENPPGQALVKAQWPAAVEKLRDPDTEVQIETVRTVIRTIRDIRNKYNKKPSEELTASANGPEETAATLNENNRLICQLAALKEFEAAQNLVKPKYAAAGIVGQMEVYLHGAIDAEAERKRLNKQKVHIAKGLKATESKLQNQNFVKKAKPEVVQQAREKLAELGEQLKSIDDHLSELEE